MDDREFYPTELHEDWKVTKSQPGRDQSIGDDDRDGQYNISLETNLEATEEAMVESELALGIGRQEIKQAPTIIRSEPALNRARASINQSIATLDRLLSAFNVTSINHQHTRLQDAARGVTAREGVPKLEQEQNDGSDQSQPQIVQLEMRIAELQSKLAREIMERHHYFKLYLDLRGTICTVARLRPPQSGTSSAKSEDAGLPSAFTFTVEISTGQSASERQKRHPLDQSVRPHIALP